MASRLPSIPPRPSPKLRQRLIRNNSLRIPANCGEPRRCSIGKRGQEAVTILDSIAVLAIVAILLAFALPNFGNYLRKAQEVRCMANMRNITVGLRGYLQDHENVWPQGPPPDAGVAWEDFWLGVLKPYGITDKTWQCPGIVAKSDPEITRVHYVPTLFPAVPGIADRWPTHPWLMERGEGHGNGALICFPDGSIKSFDKVLAELGAR